MRGRLRFLVARLGQEFRPATISDPSKGYLNGHWIEGLFSDGSEVEFNWRVVDDEFAFGEQVRQMLHFEYTLLDEAEQIDQILSQARKEGEADGAS